MKMIAPIRIAIVSCLGLALLAGGAALVSAQSQTNAPTRRVPTPTPLQPQERPPAGINLTISPSFLNLSTDPGKPLNSEFRVTNNNNFTEYLEVDLAKFTIDAAGKPQLAPVTSADTFVSWVNIPEKQFSVAPQQTKTVKFTLSPPASASLGYYYAFVINRIQQEAGVRQGAALAGAPALLTLLEVRSNNAKREMQLVDLKTDHLWYEYLPTTFTVTVKNTGNIHVVPSGNIFIDQGSKKDVGILSVNSSHGNVLPQTSRDFTATWTDGFPVRAPKMENGQIVKDDHGQVEYTTTYDFAKANTFRIGKYTANLLLVYDNGERDVPLEATVSFWVIPWKVIGIVLLVLVFMFLGVRSTLGSLFRGVRKK